ncbi:MAG TPA: LapA family protein [Deltaproteobacteria bacterium]|nr:LapA family protein [Deltaproteobacteria bacterium]OQC27502.1 MAG: hypothetical protein BWX71_01338 [Deltaproteobacteria bacterium ADurb.Bin072]HRW79240.1 LapA family protein [Desulfomonilia bacterium]NMD39712.1 LapA family protein [Deltaproteobacteria bacterium]HNQ85120.1 LapA family protein [Deltaproteobacteria bacterium]
MRYAKALLFIALAVAGILFGVSNQGTATVHFYWFFSKSYPLYIVLFACFIAGTMTAILFSFIYGGHHGDEERRLTKRRDDLEERFRKAQPSLDHQGKADGASGRAR